jgi:hypothetical protein
LVQFRFVVLSNGNALRAALLFSPDSWTKEISMSEDDDLPDTAAEAEGGEGGKTRGTALQKKALVDAVAAASGVKKRTVKPVVDAVLAEIGAALSAGNGLNLPPLGRVGINRTRGNDRADVMILKLKRSKPGAAPAEADGESESEEAETA